MAKPKALCIRSAALPNDGGGESKASSPRDLASPKSVVGSYALDQVPAAWDDSHVIRDRIRENKNLLLRWNPSTREVESHGFIEATCENCKLNSAVLLPVLGVMRNNELQLPSIEMLLAAIETFYQLSKVARSTDQVYQEAWSIRRLIGKTKKFIYRSSAPQDWYSDMPTEFAQTDICYMFKSMP